jgi:hypothetical protein
MIKHQAVMRTPMPDLGTAVWLVEHTALTFEQIASFCGMTVPEVQAVADDELASGQPGRDPIAAGLLTAVEIARCTNAPAARLARFSPRTRAALPIADILRRYSLSGTSCQRPRSKRRAW